MAVRARTIRARAVPGKPPDAAVQPVPDHQPPARRWSSQNVAANLVLVLGVTLAIALPAFLCVRAWHAADTMRGIGPHRGTFTVASCGNPHPADGATDYTCTGTFTGESAPAVTATLNAHADYRPGSAHRAYTAAAHVHLADAASAADKLAIHITVAVLASSATVTAAWLLSSRIRTGRRSRLPDNVITALVAAGFSAVIVWVLLVVALDLYYHFW